MALFRRFIRHLAHAACPFIDATIEEWPQFHGGPTNLLLKPGISLHHHWWTNCDQKQSKHENASGIVRAEIGQKHSLKMRNRGEVVVKDWTKITSTYNAMHDLSC